MSVPLSVVEVIDYTPCVNQTGNHSEFFSTICQPNASDPIPEDIEPEIRDMKQIVNIVKPMLIVLIIFLGLFGNTLVIIVVSANHQLNSTMNLLIMNLAVADLSFIVFCVPFTAIHHPFWPFGGTWCKMVHYLFVMTAYAKVFTLVLMNLNRFLAFVHPVASKNARSEKNAILAIAVMWVVVSMSSIPVFLFHEEVTSYHSSTEHTACIFLARESFRPDGFNKPAFQISFFAVSYVMPLAQICGLYIWMLLVRLGVAPRGQCSNENRRGEKRETRIVVVVVFIFAICWCPIQVIMVVKSVDMFEIANTSDMVQFVSHVLACMNSCVNPILYAFLSEDFRKAFRKVIYCGQTGVISHGNGRPDQEKSALTKTTRTNDIL